MKISLLIVVLLLVIAAPDARADHAENIRLIEQLMPVLQANDVEAARPLIAAPNFSPTLRFSPQTFTIFEQALSNNEVEIAQLMMQSANWKKVRWNATNTAQPLTLAAYTPELLPLLQAMARQPGFDINTPQDYWGESPLSYAANKNNLIALQWLVSQPKVKFNARNKQGQNALFDAGVRATTYLISLDKIDVNARDTNGQTALHHAVDAKQVARVKALLQARDINPNIRDDSHHPSTPLDIALSYNSVAIASALMNHPKTRATARQRALLKRLGKGGGNDRCAALQCPRRDTDLSCLKRQFAATPTF